jgi:hypothetical protein
MTISINPLNSNHPVQAIFNATQRPIHPRHRPSEIVHHQRDPSNLPRRPPRLHSTKILKQPLRITLSP